MEITGHANLTTTQQYLNTRIERLRQEFCALLRNVAADLHADRVLTTPV
jgi:hypothetical protein